MSNNYEDNIIDIDMEEKNSETYQGNNHISKILIKAQGSRLNILRRNLGYNLKDFGNFCGIEPGMLGRYDRGSTAIHTACVLNICLQLRSQGYLISPEWILDGKGICPRIINSNTDLQLKNIEEFNSSYDQCTTNKYKLFSSEINNPSSMFNGSCNIIGTSIDLSKEENFIDLNYIYCNITTDKSVIAIVSYDFERKLFIVNEEGVDKPYTLTKDKIKNLSIINGFWNKKINKG